MTQQLEALSAATEDPGSVFSTHVLTHTQPPVTPIPEGQMPSSGIHEYCTHMMHIGTGRHLHITHKSKINAEDWVALSSHLYL